MSPRFVEALAASLLVSGAAALGVSSPVHAAAQGACATSTGVTVVVDFNTLPGGVDVDCVGAGEPAIAQLFAAGHSVEQVQRFPGAICRIDHQPGSGSCVNMPPASAYWWFWWSDGQSGEWTYSTEGAGTLTVPEGGYVGFVWNADGDKDQPGVVPARKPSPSSSPSTSVKPSPSSSPTKSATTGQAQAPTTSSASTTAEPSVSTSPTSTAESESAAGENSSPSDRPTESGEDDRPTASDQTTQPPGAVPTAQTEQTEVAATSGTADSSLPGWVPLVVVVILAAVVGIVTVVRRRNLTGGGDQP